MKRWFDGGLAVLLLLLIAACGSPPAIPDAAPTTAETLDPSIELRHALESEPQRALVTVADEQAKEAVHGTSSGVTVISDYETLPALLVRIEDVVALDALLQVPGVLRVELEKSGSIG